MKGKERKRAGSRLWPCRAIARLEGPTSTLPPPRAVFTSQSCTESIEGAQGKSRINLRRCNQLPIASSPSSRPHLWGTAARFCLLRVRMKKTGGEDEMARERSSAEASWG